VSELQHPAPSLESAAVLSRCTGLPPAMALLVESLRSESDHLRARVASLEGLERQLQRYANELLAMKAVAPPAEGVLVVAVDVGRRLEAILSHRLVFSPSTPPGGPGRE
jgi:hypothetical protein